MPESTDQLECFLRAVHRRLVVVRAVERAGICLLVAAGFAAVLALGMWWEGRDALAAVGSLLVLGGVMGLAWGLARRPRVIDAAMEADRQLKLADLLGTALASLRDADPWSRSVVAMAEARVRNLAPGSVILHRYGARAWGGIGLSAALVLTLGAMSSLARSAQAQPAARAGVPLAGQRVPPARSHADAEQGGGANRVNRSEESANVPAAQTGERGTGARAGLERAEAGAPASVHSREPGGGEPSSGAGSAAGRTDQSNRGGVPTLRTDEPNETSTAELEGESAGGAGGTDSSAKSSGASGLISRAADGETSARPWESAAWSRDRARAEEAVRSGSVPDAYRDVIRGYFRSDGAH